MKKFFKISLAFVGAALLSTSAVKAQQSCTPTGCTVDPAVFLGIACFNPNPLPDGEVGVAYDQTIQFTSTDTLPDNPTLTSINLNNKPVNKIILEKLNNLPEGLSYVSKSSNPADAEGVFTNSSPTSGVGGCIRIFGTPTSSIAPDTFKVELQISLTAGTTTLPSSLIKTAAQDNLKFPLFIKATTNRNDIFSNNLNLNIYPNPVNSVAKVDYNLNEVSNVFVKVTSLDGRVVFSTAINNQAPGAHTINIDANNLPTGMYVATFSNGASTVTKKFVKAN